MKRFEDKYVIDSDTGCWVWLAGKSTDGYGRFYYKGKTRNAHRVAYSLYVGTIDDDLVIDHVCRNKACVNPSHLRAVSQRQNVLENSVGEAAKNINKTHCKHGHEFTPENTYDNHGGRGCITCLEEYRKEYRRKNLEIIRHKDRVRKRKMRLAKRKAKLHNKDIER